MAVEPNDVEYQVRQALLNDPRTSDSVIDVEYMDGVITLRGAVASLRISEAAEEIARQQEGVEQVINQLWT